MPKVLYVSSSVRPDDSHSHALGTLFCDALAVKNPDLVFVRRSVGINPPPHPDAAYTEANYTSPDLRTAEMNAALSVSDKLIDELLAADILVFSVPMYNFSIPSTFKAYIDNIVRIGRTFGVNDDGSFFGLLKGKKTVFITSRGAVYGKESPIRAFDQQEPYLRTVFGFMGIGDPEFVHADGLDFAAQSYRKESLAAAESTLIRLAQSW